jgi:hypothetical protein
VPAVDPAAARSSCQQETITPMQYMALIYDSEQALASMTPNDREQFMGDYFAFSKAAKEAGVYVAGDALKAVDTATTLRIRGGETMHTDGPFAETKEQLGGYYLLECKDLDEALAWAAKIPSAKTGSIEVRPVMVF